MRISSETLPASGYALANDAILLRTGGQSWDFSRGVEVTYRYGTLPPTMGKNAAIRLGNEFLLAYCGSDKCSLPERVTNITRQGVSFTVLDPQDFLKQGRTGLYEVDLFLSIANPMNARKRARVYNPDWPRGERRR